MTHWTEATFVERADVFADSLEGRVESAPDEVDDIRSLVASHDVEPETVLDVACGIGRHAIEFAASGLSVHGVDLSPTYVESARERAAEAGVEESTTFDVGDMRELPPGNRRYDLVTNCWTSFGFFDDATNEAVAAGFFDCVNDGGAVVLELANKEGILSGFCESSVTESDGTLYTERREYSPETGRISSDVTVFRETDSGYDCAGEISWDLRLYSPAELCRILERAGFGSVHCYGGLDGRDLDRESTRMAIVATP